MQFSIRKILNHGAEKQHKDSNVNACNIEKIYVHEYVEFFFFGDMYSLCRCTTLFL